MFWPGEIGEYEDEDEVEDEVEEVDPVPEMALLPHEHYDSVVLIFRNTWDWTRAVEALGLVKKGFTVFDAKTGKKLRARSGFVVCLTAGTFLSNWRGRS